MSESHDSFHSFTGSNDSFLKRSSVDNSLNNAALSKSSKQDPPTSKLEMTAYYGLNMGMSAICQIGPVM